MATENLRQLCFFQRAAAKGVPWLWWAYATGVVDSCDAAGGNFKPECSFGVMERLGFSKQDRDAVSACVGDVSADRTNPVMEAERAAQADNDGVRGGEVVLLPTIVINGKEYRGRLDSGSILKGLCAGFAEGAEPPICLGGFIEARARLQQRSRRRCALLVPLPLSRRLLPSCAAVASVRRCAAMRWSCAPQPLTLCSAFICPTSCCGVPCLAPAPDASSLPLSALSFDPSRARNFRR